MYKKMLTITHPKPNLFSEGALYKKMIYTLILIAKMTFSGACPPALMQVIFGENFFFGQKPHKNPNFNGDW